MRKFKYGDKNYYIGIMNGHNFPLSDSLNIWYGTASGLRKYNKITKTDIKYLYNNLHSEVKLCVTNMYLDSDGILWLACWNNGLITFDTKSETFIGYKYNPEHPPGIGSNVVFDINADNSGKLWIVTSGDGYYQYDKNIAS